MTRNIKYRGLSIALALAALFTATSASAYTVTIGGTPVAGEGEKSSVFGAVTTDFNSGLLPGNYVGGGVVLGDSSGAWASPPGDISNYYTVGPSTSTPGTLSLGFLSSYFGYYGGSPDAYNSIELLNGSTSIKTFTGTELAGFAGVPANGDQTVGRYWNISANNPGENFDTVKFISTTNAFETDNHAILAAVPEPETYAMLLAGLGLMGFVARRRKNEQA